jgi:hypothetical protein
MCYSAQIRTGYEKYVRAYGADISIREFVQLYWQRSEGGKITTGERVLGCPSDLGRIAKMSNLAVRSSNGSAKLAVPPSKRPANLAG